MDLPCVPTLGKVLTQSKRTKISKYFKILFTTALNAYYHPSPEMDKHEHDDGVEGKPHSPFYIRKILLINFESPLLRSRLIIYK